MIVSASKHFKYNEFKCPCCIACDMDKYFVDRLENLRNIFNKPIILNSAYRCEQHNKAVGGVLNSAHTQGRAVDIKISGEDAYHLLNFAMAHDFEGIGIKQHGDFSSRFIHLDNLVGNKRPRIWSYK